MTLLMFLFLAQFMPFPGPVNSHAAAGLTIVQKVGALVYSAGSESVVCVAHVCTLTVPSQGSGHQAVILYLDGNDTSNFISSVTASTESWSVPTGAQLNDSSSSFVAISGACTASTVSGTTSIVITLSANSYNSASAFTYFEISGGTACDTTNANTVNHTSGTSSQVGPVITLSHTNEAIAQMCGTGGAVINSASSPYNTNFVNTDSTSSTKLNAGGSIAVTTSGAGAVFASNSGTASVCNGIPVY